MSQATAPSDIRRDLVALLPRLRRFALTLSADPALADRLVRETCIRAVEKSHHWKGEGRIESWLFGMIRMAWTDEAKRRRHAQAGADAPNATADAKPSGAIGALPEGCASAMLLADVEGFNYAEASTILGLPADLYAARLCEARLVFADRVIDSAERRA